MDTLITVFPEAPKLDPREQHFHVPSPREGLTLFLRYLPPTLDTPPDGRTVLYVHGGTFSSALSIAHRFDGRSWRDQLCAAVWLSDGEVLPGSERKPDLRTPFAFDSRHRLLFLAVVRTSRPG